MSQPKITTDQLNVGAGTDSLLTFNSLYEVGSGRVVGGVHGPISSITDNTVIPFDNSAPLISEGTQIGTATYTTTQATSHVHVFFSIGLDADTNNTDIVVAVFRDSTCIASEVVNVINRGKPQNFALTIWDDPGLGTFTYSGRVGASITRTWYVNSNYDGNNMGGTLKSSFVVLEFA